jgi:predicted anti-sigma-YlaC factor YlaD
VHEETRRQLSAFLDGELHQAEDQRVRLHLEDCAECRAHFDELRGLHEVTSGLRFVEPPEDRMDELERRLSVSAPRAMGWTLIVIGFLVWLSYAVYLFVVDPDVANWQKLTVAAIGIGAVLLLVSVARQRWLELPSDRYRGVKR